MHRVVKVNMICAISIALAGCASTHPTKPLQQVEIESYIPDIANCRMAPADEVQLYSDSIRLTYTLMQDQSMSFLFGDQTGARALKVVEEWHRRIHTINLGDFTGHPAIVPVSPNLLDWDAAFDRIETELKKNDLYKELKFRELYTKIDLVTDRLLWDDLGSLAALGMDLPMLTIDRVKAKQILESFSGFRHIDNCGKLDLRDFYTSCTGNPNNQAFKRIVAHSRAAGEAGLLCSNIIWIQTILRGGDMKPMTGMCCDNLTNKCKTPSHDSCTMCGSYCCLTSYWCSP